MAELINYLTAIGSLGSYPNWLSFASIGAVCALTQLLKLPVKYSTSRLIPNANLRKKVNSVIMLIPLGLGILASWIYTFWGYELSVEVGILWGITSEVVYEFVSRIVARIKKGEDITDATIAEDLKASTASKEKEFEELVGKVKKKK